MKLAAAELAAKLTNLAASQYPKIVLVNGSEPLLVEEALDELRAQLLADGFDERLSYHLEAGFDWQQITGAGQMMSLFAQRRIIELRVSKSLGVAGSKALVEYCATPSEDDLLIVIMPALDYKQRQAKWVKVIDNAGWIVDVSEVSREQFPRWLKQRFQDRAVRVEAGVVELLAEQLEGNLLAAAQEVDKLKVLANNNGVNLELVQSSLADQARYDVYTLVDDCLTGEFTRVLRVLGRLKSEGVEPVIVVWALVRDIRQLVSIQAALTQGQNISSAFKQNRVWRKRESLIKRALNRLSYSQLLALLAHAATLDQAVKGQQPQLVGDAWHQIEYLCGQMCGQEDFALSVA